MPAAISPSRAHSSPGSQQEFAHVFYDNNPLSSLAFNPPSSSTMYNQLAHPSPWQTQFYAANAFPSTPPPPPPVAHKVWILDCQSCGMFLTNRGMKAVLLLRPHVSLYSSDALPVNCSAFTSNPDAIRSRAAHRAPPPSVPPRTCECLTQTLCCHGCGGTVGYMIVIPCARCTSSISATSRATNGHRFVFHAGEVAGTERHYIPGEPGVIPVEPMGVFVSAEPTAPHTFVYPPAHSRDSHQDQVNPQHRSYSPAPRSDYLPTPPLEFADPMLLPPGVHPTFASNPYPPINSSNMNPVPPHAPPPFSQQSHRVQSPFYHPHPLPPPFLAGSLQRSSAGSHAFSSPASRESSLPPLVSPPPSVGLPAEQKEQSNPRVLKAGDLIFWHHLARSGEIPGVEDDDRARGIASPLPSLGQKMVGKVIFNR